LTLVSIEQLAADQNANPVQALGIDESAVVTGAFNGTTTTLSLPIGYRLIEVTVTETCRIKFGASGVTADSSSRILSAGTYVYKLLRRQQQGTYADQTHVAVLEYATGVSGDISIAPLV